ncbi:MAG: sigma 54-interacting transcriptional regulator [Candidatus Krumholzibacteriota bacterium]|nr:sigma 54-interacting transcriptional regulator [Candidatus Krumholzibacteriota bacterium]
MQKDKRALKKHISEISRLQADGEYRRAYLQAREALRLARESSADSHTLAAVLVAAARNAYYLSLFEECEEHLDRLGRLRVEYTPLASSPAVREASIIKANIARRRGQYHAALALLEGMEEKGAGEFSAPLVTERLLIRGACLYHLGKPVQARADLEASLGLATHFADNRAQARILAMLGLLTQSEGFIAPATDYFHRSIELCRTGSDSYGEAAAWLNLGIALYKTGKFNEARKAVTRAKLLFRRVEWELGMCRCRLVSGNIYRKQGDFASALREYARVGKSVRKHGFLPEKVFALELSGAVHFQRGNYEKAVELYEEALSLVRGSAPEGALASDVRRRLGELYLATGDIDSARDSLEKACAIARGAGRQVEEGLALRLLGVMSYQTGREEKGVEFFRLAVERIRPTGCTFELAATQLLFAQYLLGEEIDMGRGRSPRQSDPCRAGGVGAQRSDDAQRYDEAWRNLMEAGHIFSGMDADFLRSRTHQLLRDLWGKRRVPGYLHRRKIEPRNIISIEHSADYMINDHFAAVSGAMQDVWRKIQFAGTFTRPVLITGETGTGKELIAQFVHQASDRAESPFVAINCAAVPDHLFESEFFGHRKGCFTGAATDRKGLFEEAHGGTLFLDEVGELSTVQQVKLLRVLQEGKVRRLGENFERPIDVRIVSATNQDLEKRITEAGFREDLYYRINAESIHLTPLRERPEDIIPLLTWSLRGRGAEEASSGPVRIEADALKQLQAYRWPGNARELLSVIERIRHLSRGNTVTADMLPEKIRSRGEKIESTLMSALSDREAGDTKRKLKKMLTICNGNKTAVAKWLGISRGTLYKELRQAGLEHFIRRRPAI